MTPANKPLLSAEARAALESYRYEAVHIVAALAEIDRLRSQVEALATELAHVCHDRMEEGAWALVERAVSEEREACCRLACLGCAAGKPLVQTLRGAWGHSERATPGVGTIFRCDADVIRARGRILLPLPPHRLVIENKRLRAALGRIVDELLMVRSGPFLLPVKAIEAARELLKCAASG